MTQILTRHVCPDCNGTTENGMTLEEANREANRHNSLASGCYNPNYKSPAWFMACRTCNVTGWVEEWKEFDLKNS